MRRCGVGAAAALVALAFACRAASAATGGDFESPDAIRAAIADTMRPRLAGMTDATIDTGVIDPRMQLPACPSLQVSVDATAGAMTTAKVECPSPVWTLYIPVRIHAWVEAVVAAENLTPATRLTDDLLTRRRVDMFAASGALVTDPARVAGKILRVGLVAGSPVLASSVENPLVVHRGQRVLLTLTDGSMVIKDSLVAMEDGRVGDTIAMQNPESQKIVHATVAGDGAAEIRF